MFNLFKLLISFFILTVIPNFVFGQNENCDSLKIINKGQTDSTVLVRLKQLDKKAFIGKEVEMFLKNRTVRSFSKRHFVAEPPNRLAYLLLSYGHDIVIRIVPQELVFQKRFSRTNSWDSELFNKEKIAKIILVYKGKVIDRVE